MRECLDEINRRYAAQRIPVQNTLAMPEVKPPNPDK